MTGDFQSLFRSDNSQRDKFRSRLFGIFSEEIVRCWARDSHAPYTNLGRPTVRAAGQQRGSTLDFTFVSKSDGKAYIAEMKCELEYEGYRYLTLEAPSQLEHHRNEAFRAFLDVAKNPSLYLVSIGGKPQPISGSILVWGRCSEQGRASVIEEYGFREVLSLEGVIEDLVTWQNPEYIELLEKYETWTTGLFKGLLELRRRPIG